MYIVLIGPSGVRKGTAMAPGFELLEDIGISIASEAITREALIRELSEQTDTEYTEEGERILHTSLTIYSEELTVFLGYQNLQLISDLCDWYDCKRRWKYRTKGAGTDSMVNIWVNLFGATTPTTLVSALPSDAIGSGLTARVIFVFEEEKGKWVSAPFQTDEDLELRKALLSDLEAIYLIRGQYKVTDKFLSHWVSWYDSLRTAPKPSDYRLHGYWSRRPAHILKLCMILSASHGDSLLIDDNDFNRALYFLEFTEKKMARTFVGMGDSNVGAHLQRVMTMIMEYKELLLSDLMRAFHFDLDNFALKNILNTLELEGFAKVTKVITQTGVDFNVRYIGGKKDEQIRSRQGLGIFNPEGNLITRGSGSGIPPSSEQGS